MDVCLKSSRTASSTFNSLTPNPPTIPGRLNISKIALVQHVSHKRKWSFLWVPFYQLLWKLIRYSGAILKTWIQCRPHWNENEDASWSYCSRKNKRCKEKAWITPQISANACSKDLDLWFVVFLTLTSWPWRLMFVHLFRIRSGLCWFGNSEWSGIFFFF